MALQFPQNPTTGQIFTGDNTVTYVYTGDRWSSQLAIYNGAYEFAYEGGNAYSIYNPLLDLEIDGGDASGS